MIAQSALYQMIATAECEREQALGEFRSNLLTQVCFCLSIPNMTRTDLTRQKVGIPDLLPHTPNT